MVSKHEIDRRTYLEVGIQSVEVVDQVGRRGKSESLVCSERNVSYITTSRERLRR